jgi:hypothetical protein
MRATTARTLMLAALAAAATTAPSAAVVVSQAISEAEVQSAQAAWCSALVNISSTHQSQGQAAARALAEQVIDAAYGYQRGAVLFKPTLTTNPQTFRTTRAGALSYFVGGDAEFPNDTGFALKGWTGCEPATVAVFITGNSAMTLGKVHFTDKHGNRTSVDKTWGYVKDDNGDLRIVLHHSSLEFTGE